jgi:hypothetical protein
VVVLGIGSNREQRKGSGRGSKKTRLGREQSDPAGAKDVGKIRLKKTAPEPVCEINQNQLKPCTYQLYLKHKHQHIHKSKIYCVFAKEMSKT